MELEEIKLYLRVDSEEEDNFILSLQAAAEEFLENSGVKKNYNQALYKTAIKMLVSSWYDNRDVIGNKNTLSMMFQCIIGQLIQHKESDIN